ncbi:MAG: hypothetical protein AAAB23_27440 [Pseudomonas sp.]
MLDSFQVFKIGLPSFPLILGELFRVHVGLIEKVKGGVAQVIGVAEQLFVTLKRQIQAGYRLIGSHRTVHCCDLFYGGVPGFLVMPGSGEKRLGPFKKTGRVATIYRAATP